MAHSNFHPYPLPFPNDDQRIQISSYSSLANALGTDPGYASRQGRRPPPNCDAVIDKPTIYLDRPPVSNPSYPYPARNVFNPGTYPARTPLSVSNGRLPSNASVVWGENSDQNDLHGLPPRYDRLPQPFFVEPDMAHGYKAGAEFPVIHFLCKGDKTPYSLWDLLTMGTMPDLVAGDLPIFVQSPERWIKIKFIWPGYSRYPFEKRILMKRSAPLTPNLLLMTLAYHIQEFVRWIRNEGAVIEPGQEYWTVTGVRDGAPAMWKNCVIIALQHLTGSIWQPEIYYLRG
ncbi:hypothetical protein OG21DRAFT_1041233 [Imleria badia]|nr:hypothetical protein OG21DRAFT_1041233 [Imleria badia]